MDKFTKEEIMAEAQELVKKWTPQFVKVSSDELWAIAGIVFGLLHERGHATEEEVYRVIGMVKNSLVRSKEKETHH